MEAMNTHTPGRTDLGRFAVFLSAATGIANQRASYHDELPSPTLMIATAGSAQAAAVTACRWLAQADQVEDATQLALIIRDRDQRRNVALIQWRQAYSNSIEYRHSVETWDSALDEYRRQNYWW